MIVPLATDLSQDDTNFHITTNYTTEVIQITMNSTTEVIHFTKCQIK
jgi:hypothetical protein